MEDFPPGDFDDESQTGGGLFQTEDLDREKFSLEKQKYRDAKLLAQLDQKLDHVRKSLMEKRARMSQYDTTFLVTGNVQELDEDKLHKTLHPDTRLSQRPLYEKSLSRFGRHEAVMGTKKVIRKHLTQIQKLTGVMGKKLNTAEHRNDEMRKKIDGLRKEHLVYDRLFDRLQNEINATRANIDSSKDKIAGKYTARDQVRRSIQGSMHSLEEAQIVAKTEWAVMDKGLEEMEALAAGVEIEQTEGQVGGNMSQEQERYLKQQQHVALTSINSDQQQIDKLQAVYQHYREAIIEIQNDTGFDDIETLIQQMDQFEDEKFGTVSAINKIMVEIEERESTVQRMTAEFEQKEDSNLALTSTHRKSLDVMQRQVQSIKGDVEEKKERIKTVLRELSLVLKPVQRLFGEVGALDVFGGAAPTLTAFPVLKASSAGVSIPESNNNADEPAGTTAASGGTHTPTLQEDADIHTDSAILSAPESKDADDLANEGKTDEASVESKAGDTFEDGSKTQPVEPEGSVAGEDLELEVGFNSEALDSPTSPAPAGLRMYMMSPSLRETFVSGVDVNTLSEFTTMMEQAASEILQKYAVVMAAPRESSAGQAALAALKREGHSTSNSNPAAAALGPTHGTKNSRSGLTSSALMAAMVDPDAMTIPEDNGEDVKPYTIADLKEQATAQLRSQQFTSAKAASKQAAKYLVQTQNRQR